MDQTYLHRTGLMMAVALTLATLSGCQVFGLGAYIADGGSTTVAAAYDGLAGKTIAILVAADEDTLYANPNIADEVCRTVSSALASNVQGATMLDPRQTVAFQQRNPFWYTVPPGDIVRRLKVERLIIIDMVQFQTQLPGSGHMWQGKVKANIDIVEAESANPAGGAYHATVAVAYPPDGRVSLLDSDTETMRFGMLKAFAAELSGLFSQHKVVRW